MNELLIEEMCGFYDHIARDFQKKIDSKRGDPDCPYEGDTYWKLTKIDKVSLTFEETGSDSGKGEVTIDFGRHMSEGFFFFMHSLKSSGLSFKAGDPSYNREAFKQYLKKNK